MIYRLTGHAGGCACAGRCTRWCFGGASPRRCPPGCQGVHAAASIWAICTAGYRRAVAAADARCRPTPGVGGTRDASGRLTCRTLGQRSPTGRSLTGTDSHRRRQCHQRRHGLCTTAAAAAARSHRRCARCCSALCGLLRRCCSAAGLRAALCAAVRRHGCGSVLRMWHGAPAWMRGVGEARSWGACVECGMRCFSTSGKCEGSKPRLQSLFPGAGFINRKGRVGRGPQARPGSFPGAQLPLPFRPLCTGRLAGTFPETAMIFLCCTADKCMAIVGQGPGCVAPGVPQR